MGSTTRYFECERGHEMTSETGKTITRCHACLKGGKPCEAPVSETRWRRNKAKISKAAPRARSNAG